LSRIDLCSNELPELITIDRGLIHIPIDSQRSFNVQPCRKQLPLPRYSRLQLFVFDASSDLNVRLFNYDRRLNTNEYLDVNITQDESIQFEWRNTRVNREQILLYFQGSIHIEQDATSMLIFN
jgi:hypothetical protein